VEEAEELLEEDGWSDEELDLFFSTVEVWVLELLSLQLVNTSRKNIVKGIKINFKTAP